MKYIKDIDELFGKVCDRVPKVIKDCKGKPHRVTASQVIQSVEYDPQNGGELMQKPSYWVYLKSGFVTEGGYGCHIIHEDNLKNIAIELADVVYDPEDE